MTAASPRLDAGTIPPVSPSSAMPGPADVADPHAAPHRAVTEAPAPGARPGPGMALTTDRCVDAGPATGGAGIAGGDPAAGPTWPHRPSPAPAPAAPGGAPPARSGAGAAIPLE